MKYNTQQLAAINALGKNVILSASAGAGKTTVLIARLLKRITQDHLSVNEICAMTFTEKAAAEMKKRLSSELHKEYENNPSEQLYEQLSQLQTAQISTIHSFCLSVISEFGYLIGFDPGRVQNILSDDALKLLKQEAIDHVFETYIKENNQSFKELAMIFSTKPIHFDDFKQSVIKLYEESQIHLDPQQWLKDCEKPYLARTFKELPDIYQKTYLSTLTSKTKGFINDLEHLHATDEKVSLQIEHFISELHRLLQAIRTGDLDEIASTAKSTFKSTFSTIRGDEEFKNQRDQFMKQIRNDGDLDIFFYHNDLELVNPQQLKYVRLLSQMATQYGKHFEFLKEEKQAIDFNDIEQTAYRLLSDESGVARTSYQKRYKEILVDEFQDTNFFQEAIIKLISTGDNIFRVGDVKQSIYGFRHAKPDIMRKHIENLTKENEVLYLSNNFRSKQNIIEFNNKVFSKLMNIESFKDTYSIHDHVTAGIPKQLEDNRKVRIHLPSKDQDMSVTRRDGQTEDIESKEPIIVAYTIAQAINTQVHAKEFNYKDICILVRSHHQKRELKKAFDDHQIPYYFDSKEGFTHAYSVQDILNFINLLLHPQEEFYLVAFLLSSLGGYDENKISRLKLHSNNHLFENLKTFDPHLSQQLNQLRDDFDQLTMSEGLIQLYQFNDYYHSHLPLEQKSNLDLLYQKVVTYEQSPHTGWQGFLKQMEMLEVDDKSDSAASVDENADVVTVLTIHQAKGLQYPVIYYFPNSRVTQKSKHNTCVIDSDCGVSLYHFDHLEKTKRKHLIRSIIEAKIDYDETQESLRLLYVALTRAQDQLNIVGTHPGELDPTLSPATLLKGEGHLKSILKSLDPHSQLYEIVEEELIDIKSSSTRKKVSPSFPIPPKKLREDKEDVHFYEPHLDLSHGLKATEKGSLIHAIIAAWPKNNFDNGFLEKYDLDDLQISQLLTYKAHPTTKELHLLDHDFEVGYAWNNEGEIIVGIMDFVAMTEHEVILVDFKSDRVSDPQTLIERYTDQLEGYKKVLQQEYPDKPIKAYLYSLALGDYLSLK